MLSVLLGPDNFSKQQYVKDLSQAQQARLEFFSDLQILPLDQVLSRDIFSKKNLFAISGGLKFLNESSLESLIKSANLILFLEDKVDKRLKFSKDLLANKNVQVKEFNLPHGQELDAWLIDRISSLGAKVSPEAASELAIRLGRDNAKETRFGGKVVSVEEVYNLQQADSEVQKLAAFAGTQEITIQAVKDLVVENGEVDVFDLTNAIADNQKQQAFDLLQGFLKQQTGSDEKGAVIQLNALLSEQFRNVALIQDFMSHKTSETDILEKTGWKSGRLFVIKKIASRFAPVKIMDTLKKLQALDEELKTSQTPPRVLLDLIISQLLA